MTVLTAIEDEECLCCETGSFEADPEGWNDSQRVFTCATCGHEAIDHAE